MPVGEELLKIAAQAAVQHFTAPHWERRMAGAVACALVGAVAGFAALGSAVAALGLWVAPKIGPALACVVCTGALLLVALVVALIARSLMARPARSTDNLNLQNLAFMLESGGQEMRAALERHIPALIVAALVGGLVTGLRGRGQRRR